IRCTVMRLLKTTVHVESRRRSCRARKTSPTPASPAWVATRMCSIYFVLGGAFCQAGLLAAASNPPSAFFDSTDLDLGGALDGLFERARHLQQTSRAK